MNKKKIENTDGGKHDYWYLISAHVEPRTSGGLLNSIKHLSGHFSTVANYREGKKIGSNLLNFNPSDSKLIKELSVLDTNAKNQNSNSTAKNKGFDWKRYQIVIQLFPGFFWLGFILWVVSEFGNYENYIAHLIVNMTPFGPPFNRTIIGILGILGFISSIYLFKKFFGNLDEQEKFALIFLILSLSIGIASISGIISALLFTNQIINLVLIVSIYVALASTFFVWAVSLPLTRLFIVALIITTFEL
ncbi:MAG: hypothetical protein ACXACA_06390, partial [Candidatus Ranarchaeia archaeon]